MATEIVTSFWQICDDAGDPVSGALVHVYDVTTTTHQNLFSDTALSVGVANPIVCDSAGRHAMRYKAAGSYKILVTTAAAVTLYERDNIDGRIPLGGTGILAIANGGTSAATAPAALAALGGATAAELADLAAQVAAISGAIASTEMTHIATGNTAQRPAAPAEGDIRRNSETLNYEGYTGAAWVNFAVLPTAQTDPSATDTAEGFIELAIQSEMETGTDVVRAVTPGRQHFHQSAAKAWVYFDGSGTAANIVAYNCDALTDNNTGDYTVNLTTDFSTANYAAVATGGPNNSGATGVVVVSPQNAAQAAGAYRIRAVDAAFVAADIERCSAVFFGDQA